MSALAILAASLEQLFNRRYPDWLERRFGRYRSTSQRGQKGSSRLVPHKRNPWNSETIAGLARVVRGNLIPMLESMATWHEQDLIQTVALSV